MKTKCKGLQLCFRKPVTCYYIYLGLDLRPYHTLVKTTITERRNAKSECISFLKRVHWAIRWKLDVSTFNKRQMVKTSHTVIWFDAFNHSALVNSMLCKACQRLAKACEWTECVASYLFIHSFVHLSTSFVRPLLFSRVCGRPFIQHVLTSFPLLQSIWYCRNGLDCDGNLSVSFKLMKGLQLSQVEFSKNASMLLE